MLFSEIVTVKWAKMTDLSVQKDESFIEDEIKKHCPDFVEVKARYLFYEETPEQNFDYYELIAGSKKEETQNYIVQIWQPSEEIKPHALSLHKAVKSYNVANTLSDVVNLLRQWMFVVLLSDAAQACSVRCSLDTTDALNCGAITSHSAFDLFSTFSKLTYIYHLAHRHCDQWWPVTMSSRTV